MIAICYLCRRRFEPKRFRRDRLWRTNGRCTFCRGYLVFEIRRQQPRPWKLAR